MSANLRIACILMAAGFCLFFMFNGGVENKPCTTPECSGSDTQAAHKDAFYYSLAACTVFLGLGGAILAASCAATLSGEFVSLYNTTLLSDLILGLVAAEQTGALLGLDMAIRFFQRRICLNQFYYSYPLCQLCHPCIGAFRRRYCHLSFERILVRFWRSDRKLAPCVWYCRSRQGTGCNVIIRPSCVDHDHCILPTSYKIIERVFLR